MKFFLYKSVFFFIYFLYCFPLRAQGINDVYIQSPNAASLGFFGKTNVSYFTGLIDISIPITTLRYRDIELPITLKYNSGGVLLEQHPSWVGQNWSLNAGGIITRKINGGVDEVYVTGHADNNAYAYYYKYADLNNNQWDQSSRISSYYSNSSVPKAKLEPDEFMFILPNGKSGTIMLNHLGVWQVNSENSYGLKANVRLNSNVLKLHNANNLSYVQNVRRIIFGIDIIDDDGTIYTFGDDINSIEFLRMAMQSGLSMDNVIANAWSLTKIISPNGNVVNFEYTRGSHQFIQNVSMNYTREFSIRTGDICTGNSKTGFTYSGSVITPVYLTAIKCDGFSVEFRKEVSNEIMYPYRDPVNNSNMHAFNNFAYDDFIAGHYSDVKTNGTHLLASNPHVDYKLKEIIVTDGENHRVENFGFSYNNDDASIYNQRLFLTGFHRKSKYALIPLRIAKESESDSNYEFIYNNLDKLPGYNSFETDKNGYYNRRGLNNFQFGDKFSPVFHFASIGSLISIKYPTGGRSNFHYGLNDYSKSVQRNNDGTISVVDLKSYGGGLRIDSIETIPLIGQRQIVTYIYKKNGSQTSSGINAGELENHYNYSINSADGSIKAFASVISSYSMKNLDYTMGRAVVYSEVQEIFSDGSKNIYTYSNWDSLQYRDQQITSRYDRGVFLRNIHPYFSQDFTPSGNNLVPDLARISMERERGKLLRLERMVGDVLRYRKIYQYDDTVARFEKYIRSYVTNSFAIECPIQIVSQMTVQPKKIYTYIPFLKSETEEFFDENGIVETSRKFVYSYNNLGFIDEERMENSDNRVKKKSFKYVSDFPNVTVLAEMKQKNMLSKMVESEVKIEDIELEKIKYNYEKILPSHNFNIKNQEVWFKSDLGNKISYEYNSYGNIVQRTAQANGVPISYLWAYKGQYPILKVVNMSYANLVNTIGLRVVDSLLHAYPTEQSLILIDSLIKNSNSQVATEIYTYNDLIGISNKYDVRGQAQRFEYDDYNRLTLVKDHIQNIEKSFIYNSIDVKDSINIPPIQPKIVYVKLSLGTIGTVDHNGVMKTYTPYNVSFYSDAQCTIPFTLLVPMRIKFKEKTTISSNINSTQILDYDYHRIIEAGVSSVEIASGWSYCEGELVLIERIGEQLKKSDDKILGRGLPPIEGGNEIICYNSVITLLTLDEYVVK